MRALLMLAVFLAGSGWQAGREAGADAVSHMFQDITTPPQRPVVSKAPDSGDPSADDQAEEVAEVTTQPFDATFAIFKRLCLDPVEMRAQFPVPDWREIHVANVNLNPQIVPESSRVWEGAEDGTSFAVVHATGKGAKGSVHARAQVRTCQVTAIGAPSPAFVGVRLRKILGIPPSNRLSETTDNWHVDVWATTRERRTNAVDFTRFSGSVVVTQPLFYRQGREYILLQLHRGIRNQAIHSIRIAVYS